MSDNTRHTLVIQRTLCCLLAALGAVLVWASISQAAVIGAPAFQDVSVPTMPTVAPEPATLVMLTSGILCVASKLLRGGV